MDVADEIVRVVGWPTLLGMVAWVVRKWDKGEHDFKELRENTKKAVEGVSAVQVQVTKLETNHLAHLQEGIGKLVESNEQSATTLHAIEIGITQLVERTPHR
jgi:hypothetical protein